MTREELDGLLKQAGETIADLRGQIVEKDKVIASLTENKTKIAGELGTYKEIEFANSIADKLIRKGLCSVENRTAKVAELLSNKEKLAFVDAAVDAAEEIILNEKEGSFVGTGAPASEKLSPEDAFMKKING